MNGKPRQAGLDAAGGLIPVGFVVGVCVFLFNQQTVNGWLVIGGCTAAGAAVGFIFGYLHEKYREVVEIPFYSPGSAPNMHPFQSHNWYQHEQLMEAERARTDRASGGY